jgi:hypothetical protein
MARVQARGPIVTSNPSPSGNVPPGGKVEM